MARRRNTRSIFHHGSTPDRRVVDSPEVAPVPSRTASLPQVDLEPTRQLPVFQAAQLEPVDRLSILARQETDLLRAMATAPYSEQTAMMAKLTSIRAERTAHIAAARDLDLANAIIGDHLTPVVSAGIRSTAKSDWLAQVPSVAMGSLDHEMVVEASLFYSGLHTAVKADAEELVIQSLGRARAVAGRFDADAPAAVRVFMDEIVRLAEAHPAGEPADDGVAHSTLPVIEDPTDAPETFDEDTLTEDQRAVRDSQMADSDFAQKYRSASVLKAINDTMWSHLAAVETEDDEDYDASEHDWQSKNDDTKDDADTGGDQEPEDDEDDDSPFPKKESARRTAGWVGERVFLEGVTPATVLTEPDDDGRVQVQTADDQKLWVHSDSFTTNGAPRQREASRRTAVSTEELRAAHQFLGQFKEGDSVIVSRDGREMTMYVKRPLELSDFAYEGDKLVPAGAWDSANIQVTFGPGRYTAEISVNAQAAKSGMPYIVGRADATTASRRTAAERNPNGQYSDWPGGDGACSKCFVGMPHTKAEHDESVIQGKSLGLDKHLDKAPQGTYSSRQSRRVASAVDDLRQIVDSKTMGTVNGQTVDLFSASAVLSVLDALGPENQAQFTQIIESNPAQAATVAFKLLNSQGKAASTKTGATIRAAADWGGAWVEATDEFLKESIKAAGASEGSIWLVRAGDVVNVFQYSAFGLTPMGTYEQFYGAPFYDGGATASRRTAAAGATCSVCGDAIAKDPDGTYHHDNGEKHDHEAQGASSKESRRKTAESAPCTKCGGSGQKLPGTTVCTECARKSANASRRTAAEYYDDLGPGFTQNSFPEGDKREVARWSTKGGKYTLVVTQDKWGYNYDLYDRQWDTPRSSGGFNADSDEAAIAEIESRKAKGWLDAGLTRSTASRRTATEVPVKDPSDDGAAGSTLPDAVDPTDAPETFDDNTLTGDGSGPVTDTGGEGGGSTESAFSKYVRDASKTAAFRQRVQANLRNR